MKHQHGSRRIGYQCKATTRNDSRRQKGGRNATCGQTLLLRLVTHDKTSQPGRKCAATLLTHACCCKVAKGMEPDAWLQLQLLTSTCTASRECSRKFEFSFFNVYTFEETFAGASVSLGNQSWREHNTQLRDLLMGGRCV